MFPRQQRRTLFSITMSGDLEDSRIFDKATPMKSPFNDIDNDVKALREKDMYDGDEVFKGRYGTLIAKDQTHAPAHASANPRKRRKPNTVEPRRSRRMHVPGIISNQEDDDSLLDRSSSSHPVAGTIGMDYIYDQPSSVQSTNFSEPNTDLNSTGSLPSAGETTEAPDKRMITSSTKLMAPISRPKALLLREKSKTSAVPTGTALEANFAISP
ncbi:hypothetical protein IFR05_017225, partial [Cadophora sp. M221]